MSSIALFALIFICVAVLLLVYHFCTPPDNFPKKIPTIPFYFCLLPMVKNTDQEQLYREYLQGPLEKYGAVTIYFGGRWSILISRPSYISEVFKHEDIYAKSGNQRKIPRSVLAEYTGDNVISSHGADWRLYTSVVKPGLQEDFDVGLMVRNTRDLICSLRRAQMESMRGYVMVNLLLQKFAMANMAECLLGTNSEIEEFCELQIHIKTKIFDPLFLNFPFLDNLKLQSRQEARRHVREFQNKLCSKIRQSHQHKEAAQSSNLGCRMVSAVDNKVWTATQFRHNSTIVFVAGHENPQLLMSSILWLLAEHQPIQARLRAQVIESRQSQASLQELPLLVSVIYETLRLYPPLSQLINRCTTKDVLLCNEIMIPAGTYVGYHGYSTNRDHDFWGEDAHEFRPERWGETIEKIQSIFRQANSKGTFITFHGGRRACLGQKFTMLETTVAIAGLVQELSWTVDSTWIRRMTPVSEYWCTLFDSDPDDCRLVRSARGNYD